MTPTPHTDGSGVVSLPLSGSTEGISWRWHSLWLTFIVLTAVALRGVAGDWALLAFAVAGLVWTTSMAGDA